jgi:hypothetical protein
MSGSIGERKKKDLRRGWNTAEESRKIGFLTGGEVVLHLDEEVGVLCSQFNFLLA